MVLLSLQNPGIRDTHHYTQQRSVNDTQIQASISSASLEIFQEIHKVKMIYLLQFFKILLYVHEYFACIYICAPCVCLLWKEVRKGSCNP